MELCKCTSVELNNTDKVNRERQLWKWRHFICHLSVSLWTAYSWMIHPCLVHLGKIARVPTQKQLEHTHANTHNVSQCPNPSSVDKPEMISNWTNMSLFLLFYCSTFRNTFANTSLIVCLCVNMGAGSLFWPSFASEFMSVQRLQLEHNGKWTFSMTEFVHCNS